MTTTCHRHRILDKGGSTQFGRVYFRSAVEKSLPVLSDVMSPHLERFNTLILDADRIKRAEDWLPLMQAFKANTDLLGIKVFSNHGGEDPRSVMAIHSTHSQPQEGTHRPASSWSSSCQPGGFRSRYPIVSGPGPAGPNKVSRERDSARLKPAILLDGKIHVNLCRCIARCLSQNKVITHLDFAGVYLMPSALRMLAQGLENNNTIKSLSLARCSIGDEGVALLAPSIKGSRVLTTLILAACRITERGASILAEFLKNQAVRRQAAQWWMTLRASDHDLLELQKQIQRDHPIPLKRLNLCNNMIQDRGVDCLMESLREEIGLLALDLQFNNITAVGGRIVEQVLLLNQEIIIVDLRNNNVVICDSLEVNVSLQKTRPKNGQIRSFAFAVGNADGIFESECSTNQWLVHSEDPDLQWLDGHRPLKDTFRIPVSDVTRKHHYPTSSSIRKRVFSVAATRSSKPGESPSGTNAKDSTYTSTQPRSRRTGSDCHPSRPSAPLHFHTGSRWTMDPGSSARSTSMTRLAHPPRPTQTDRKRKASQRVDHGFNRENESIALPSIRWQYATTTVASSAEMHQHTDNLGIASMWHSLSGTAHMSPVVTQDANPQVARVCSSGSSRESALKDDMQRTCRHSEQGEPSQDKALREAEISHHSKALSGRSAPSPSSHSSAGLREENEYLRMRIKTLEAKLMGQLSASRAAPNPSMVTEVGPSPSAQASAPKRHSRTSGFPNFKGETSSMDRDSHPRTRIQVPDLFRIKSATLPQESPDECGVERTATEHNASPPACHSELGGSDVSSGFDGSPTSKPVQASADVLFEATHAIPADPFVTSGVLSPGPPPPMQQGPSIVPTEMDHDRRPMHISELHDQSCNSGDTRPCDNGYASPGPRRGGTKSDSELNRLHESQDQLRANATAGVSEVLSATPLVDQTLVGLLEEMEQALFNFHHILARFEDESMPKQVPQIHESEPEAAHKAVGGDRTQATDHHEGLIVLDTGSLGAGNRATTAQVASEACNSSCEALGHLQIQEAAEALAHCLEGFNSNEKLRQYLGLGRSAGSIPDDDRVFGPVSEDEALLVHKIVRLRGTICGSAQSPACQPSFMSEVVLGESLCPRESLSPRSKQAPSDPHPIMTAQPVTFIRIKRKRNEDPVDALVINNTNSALEKKQKLGEETHEQIFHLATTLEIQEYDQGDRPARLKEVFAKRKLLPKKSSKIMCPPDSSLKKDMLATYLQESRQARYRVMARNRMIDESEFSCEIVDLKADTPDAAASFRSTADTLVPPGSRPDQEQETEQDTNGSTEDQIMCNLMPMVREYLKVSGAPAEDEYVYDIYYADHTLKPAIGGSVATVEWDQPHDALIFDDDDEDNSDDYGDEDSNAEDYCANDYPDEDDSEIWSDEEYSDYEHESHAWGHDQGDDDARLPLNQHDVLSYHVLSCPIMSAVS
ncbi:uncharacterized protein BJ171DRAFT_570855, partial [Polychytrium aggregatum]|uniref:uncharacterized protein n=1 Tax=Polychytrium aggregatum TaxID=110093 RepID=UPI0022FE178E